MGNLFGDKEEVRRGKREKKKKESVNLKPKPT